MPLVTANQFQLQPNTGQALQQGMQLGQQFRQMQQQPRINELTQMAAQGDKQALIELQGIAPERAAQVINTQGVQQQQSAQAQEQKLRSISQGALTVQSIPTVEGKIQALQKRLKDLPEGSDTSHTQEALDLYSAGKVDEANQLIGSVVTAGERQGFIRQAIKKTASQQDFDTFKQLTTRAQKTNDPVDIKLAEQFGRQSGFDRETPQELADIDVQKESNKTLVKQAATASKEAFDGLKGIRKTIANIDDAIKTLDKGAETGPIISKLPSFRQNAIELDNIKGRMGLDVVGATTFGALSESELAFALDVALPDSLKPVALKEWLVKKKEAQTKLSNELRKAASFLGTPGNTIAGYLEKQEKENPSVGNLSDDELFK